MSLIPRSQVRGQGVAYSQGHDQYAHSAICSPTDQAPRSAYILSNKVRIKGCATLYLIKQIGAAGVDWRQKLENQRGAVLATELKNNANKLAKWTASAHISGSDMIKLGYVARATPKDNNSHVILGTQVCHF